MVEHTKYSLDLKQPRRKKNEANLERTANRYYSSQKLNIHRILLIATRFGHEACSKNFCSQNETLKSMRGYLYRTESTQKGF